MDEKLEHCWFIFIFFRKIEEFPLRNGKMIEKYRVFNIVILLKNVLNND